MVRVNCDNSLRGTPDTGEGSLVLRAALDRYLTTYGSYLLSNPIIRQDGKGSLT